MPARPRTLGVRPGPIAARRLVRPPERATSLVRALAAEAVPDEVLDVVTGPFERRIVDRPPRTPR